MKKLSFVISFLLLTAVFIVPLSVSAAENPGVKPGSFFYGFVTTFEKINLFFTFSPEKKAEKALKYAEKRLAEAEAVAGDKNSNAVKTAISGYEENIAIAAEASKKIKDETKAENLLNLIAENTLRHQEILSDVLNKVPDEAKGAITKALEASKKGQEEAIKKIAELKGEVEKLKQEVADLKTKDEKREKVVEELSKQKPETPSVQTKPSTPQTTKTIQTPKPTNIVTLPTGAIVEMGTNGNIVRIIKEAPQQLLEEQQHESQKQQELERQRQEESRINSIKNQINFLLSEYENKKNAIDKQILELKKQYYKDVESIGGETIGYYEGERQRLTNEVNLKIDKLELEKDFFRLEYLDKIEDLKKQL